MAINQLISLRNFRDSFNPDLGLYCESGFCDFLIFVFKSIISNNFNLFLPTDLVCAPSPLGPS